MQRGLSGTMRICRAHEARTGHGRCAVRPEADFRAELRLSRGRRSSSARLREEACFAAARGVAMNDAALRGFIDGRDQLPHAVAIRLCSAGSDSFVQLPQARQHTAITERAALGLASAFGGGFRVGHGMESCVCGRAGSGQCADLSTRRERAAPRRAASSGARVPARLGGGVLLAGRWLLRVHERVGPTLFHRHRRRL